MPDYPGGYQSPSLPPVQPFPSPFPTELGAFGPLAYMGLQQTGMLPPGLMNFSFNPSTDLYSQFNAIRQFQERTNAMNLGTRGDISTMMRYQESIARATGADWGSIKGRAQKASDWIGGMLPILSMIMPESVDTMMGPQGSQTVMASQLSNASRFMYDPTNGRSGMTGAETAKMSDMLRSQLFGSDSATAQMRGIGAGRSGMLLNDMIARGLVNNSPFQSDSGAAASLASLVGGAGGGGTLGSLATMSTGRVDSSKVSQMGEQVKGMAKIVSAISDLFGANGQPNAPMPQLLAALDQLGQGAEYRYKPQQVESMFRNLQQATVTGAISLPQISQMVNQNAAMLASVGADPRDAIAMTQRAVNFASSSSAVFSSPFYGKMDPRTLANTSAALEASSVNSPAGQMAQIALYLADTSKPAAGSEFAQLASAIRRGETTYAGGKSVLTAMQGQNLRNVYTASGGNLNNFNAAVMNPEVAGSYAGQTAPLARRLQFSEAAQLGAGYMAGDIASIFGVGGSDNRLAIGSSLVNKVFAKAGDFAGMNPQQQAAAMEQMAAESAASVMGVPVASMLDKVRGRGAGLLATMTGAMSQTTGYDLQRSLQLFSPEMMRREADKTRANQFSSDVSSAVGDLGRYSFTQRLASELQNMQPGENIGSVLSRLVGGIDKEKMGAAMGKVVNGQTIQSAIENNLEALRRGENPEAVRQLRGHFNRLRDELKSQGIDLNTSSDAFSRGIDAIPGIMGIGARLMVNPAAAIMGGGTGAAPGSSGRGGAGSMTITIAGKLNVHNDGTADLDGAGYGEGVRVGGSTGTA